MFPPPGPKGEVQLQLQITTDGIEIQPYVQVRVPFHCRNFIERSRVCSDLAFYCELKAITFRIRHCSGGRSVLTAEGTRDQIDSLLHHVGAHEVVREHDGLLQPMIA